ncbi:hypothetical protein [Leuconostoc citreum]
MFNEIESKINGMIERIDFLEKELKEVKKRKSIKEKYISTNDAFEYIRGKRDISDSAKWQFINKLVVRKEIHRYMVEGNRMFDVNELEAYMQSKRVTGNVI